MTFPVTNEPTLELWYPEAQNFLQILVSSSKWSRKAISLERLDDHDRFFASNHWKHAGTQWVSTQKSPRVTLFFAPNLNEIIVVKIGFLSPVGPNEVFTQILPCQEFIGTFLRQLWAFRCFSYETSTALTCCHAVNYSPPAPNYPLCFFNRVIFGRYSTDYHR